ncbi:ATP-binding cassette domain-containing protein [Thermopirellula anaerolimosa]
MGNFEDRASGWAGTRNPEETAFGRESRMVKTKNLSKHYDDPRGGVVRALDGIDFEARPGEIFGLLGPNGAGKTTTLRILSTLLRPSGGRAVVAGFDCLRQPAQVRRNIGFMSVNTAVYDRMTAWEMVEYFGLLYGWTREQLHPRMELLFDRLKMNEIRDVPGGRMSTGMKQKVSIARALVHDPPVLIFDEPTSGLDVLVARNLLQTIRELRDQGKCIIFSTHIMREVEKLCDRVAILCRGRILTQGTPDELRERFQENDLEEIFFRLITETEHAEDASRDGDRRGGPATGNASPEVAPSRPDGRMMKP